MANAILVKPLPLGTVTAEGSGLSTLPGYLGNDHMGVVHRGTSTTAAVVQCDLGAARTIDFAAFLSSNATGAQTLRVRADDDSDLVAESAYDSGVIVFRAGATLPTSGRSNSWWEHASGVTQRYWRFDIAALGGTPFDAGRLVLGRKIQLARNFSFGAGRGVKDTGSASFSAQGNLLRRYGRRLRTLSLSYAATAKAEIETLVLPLLEGVGNTDPVFVCIDPAADAERQNRMYFGLLQGDLQAIHRVADGFEWRCDMTSLI